MAYVTKESTTLLVPDAALYFWLGRGYVPTDATGQPLGSGTSPYVTAAQLETRLAGISSGGGSGVSGSVITDATSGTTLSYYRLVSSTTGGGQVYTDPATSLTYYRIGV